MIQSSVERTFTGPLPADDLLLPLQILPSLPLKVLRPHVRDAVPLRVVLVTLVPGQRLPQGPGEPRRRTPAVPEGGLDVVRRGLPAGDEDAAVLVRFFREGDAAEEVWAWEGQVAQKEFADRE